MASRRIISSLVRLWALTTPGIREQQRGKIRDCRPYPLERGGHRDRRAVFAAAFDPLPNPLTTSVRLASHPADRRPRSRHQELTQRGITAFADTEPALLPARGLLARYRS